MRKIPNPPILVYLFFAGRRLGFEPKLKSLGRVTDDKIAVKKLTFKGAGSHKQEGIF